MGTIHRFPASRALNPADLDIAAAVYVEITTHLAPEDEAIRERVAESIIERMLIGERDPIRLREGALAELSRPSDGQGSWSERRSDFHASKARPEV